MQTTWFPDVGGQSADLLLGQIYCRFCETLANRFLFFCFFKWRGNELVKMWMRETLMTGNIAAGLPHPQDTERQDESASHLSRHLPT